MPTPPPGPRSSRTDALVAFASVATSARLDARNAGATNRDRSPLRITTQCVPTRAARR